MSLKHEYILKTQNFEGPFDLLFHLLEKDKVNIYDIPIDEITDQYIEYLHDMQVLDLNIASEFLVMASTLLYIKSKMLLPQKRDEQEAEEDPRDELVNRLIEYKRFKQAASILQEREALWQGVSYREPEENERKKSFDMLSMQPEVLADIMRRIAANQRSKMINLAEKMRYITRSDKITIRSKINEILNRLKSNTTIIFQEMFPRGKATRMDIVAGFMAALELSKGRRVSLSQQKTFGDIKIVRVDDGNE